MKKEYKGFTLVFGKDCWGSESWVVYKQGQQLSDCLDCESEAIEWIENYIG